MKRTEKNRLLRRIKLRLPQHWWKAKRVRTSVATQENAPVYMNHLRTNTSRTPMRRREMMVAAVQLQVIFVLQSTLGKVTPLPLGNAQGSLLSILATLPVSTSTPERNFSTLRRLKSYLRNHMNNDRSTGLALLSIHRELQVTPEQFLTEFCKLPRRKNFLV
ncbi:hypothetical protein HPB51_024721 [Rhipicephalus microplus]|uniref:HAT C-terminal dimerisation domain-containing protein n=1 Tax=Rhipicephalus microplus TaxID=6941 RepID=A0A9J6EV33_RHIMP|nr:hypothetical protein HPB51_024721 [Rhipicephalus microplus]